MPAPANVIQQSSTTTGTGDFTLAPVNGRQEFKTAFPPGVPTDVFDYYILSNSDIQWERGTGHMSDATTLVRDTVLQNNLGTTALINFSAGAKDVTNDIPADAQPRKDELSSYTAPQVGEIASEGNITGSVVLPFDKRNDFEGTTTGDITIANGTGKTVGQKGSFIIDNAGGHALTAMGTDWKRIDGTGAPTLITGTVRFDYHITAAAEVQYRYGERE